MHETGSTSLARSRDRLRVYSLLLQILVFQVEILVAHVPLGSWLFGEDVCNRPSKRQVKNQLLHRSCFGCQAVKFTYVHPLPNGYCWGIRGAVGNSFGFTHIQHFSSGRAKNTRGSGFNHHMQKSGPNSYVSEAKADVQKSGEATGVGYK
jgi:hypothetical protein